NTGSFERGNSTVTGTSAPSVPFAPQNILALTMGSPLVTGAGGSSSRRACSAVFSVNCLALFTWRRNAGKYNAPAMTATSSPPSSQVLHFELTASPLVELRAERERRRMGGKPPRRAQRPPRLQESCGPAPRDPARKRWKFRRRWPGRRWCAVGAREQPGRREANL